MSNTKSNRPAKASVALRAECLKAWQKERGYPFSPGSFLIDSPNYKYKRHERKAA